MSSRISLNQPTPSIENVTDVPMLPMIKESPSISKASSNVQGHWMDSTAVRAAAIFYIIISFVMAVMSSSEKRDNRDGTYAITMFAHFVNLCVSFKVAQYVYSFGNFSET